MKRRLLFVDDEPLVLQGIQRSLRSLRDSWDMAFVQSGEAALEALAAAPFDVVVSDMQMPGMDGAELLARVRDRHPGTVRIALSGHADHAMVIRCMASAHQYLAKPCDPEVLKACIQQVALLEDDLAAEPVRAALSRIDALPVMPELYQRLMDAFASEHSGSEQVATLLAKDPALTVEVLKLANSAYFGLPRGVMDPAQAVAFLGLEAIKAMVLVHGILGQVACLPGIDRILRMVWSHSLRVAAGARLIAESEPQSGVRPDEAFSAGLLHDLGALVLAACDPERYLDALRRASAEGVPLETAEREAFGTGHPEAGAYLLGLWGLPATLRGVVAWHHRPNRSGDSRFSSLTAVHAADTLLGQGQAPSVFDGGAADEAYLQAIGMADRWNTWKAILDQHGPAEELHP